MSNPTPQTPQDAMNHIVSVILASNAVEVTAFFTDFGVFCINAFLTLDDSDFKSQYSASSTLKKYLPPPVV